MNDIYGVAFDTELKERNDWQRHPSRSVDLAVLRYTPWADNVPRRQDGLADQRPIAHAPEYMLIRDEQFGPNGIGIGDEVYIAGLFSFAMGEQSNSPILRVGNLAMVPREPIYTGRRYGDMEAYIIEARSIGGLSGGLVLVRETVSLKKPKGPYDRFDLRKPQFHASGGFAVLGVAHGHWDVPAPQLNEPTLTRAKKNEGVNVGVAIVTPARKLREVLHAEYFTAEREHIVASINKGKPEATFESLGDSDDVPQERFERATSAPFQVPKDAVRNAEAKRPKRRPKKS